MGCTCGAEKLISNADRQRYSVNQSLLEEAIRKTTAVLKALEELQKNIKTRTI